MKRTGWFKFDQVFSKREFANLMELYDLNYQRIGQLIPDIASLPEKNVSSINGLQDLHLEIIERHAYTTELCLTHYFPDPERGGEPLIADPDLRIRIYHDAEQAEMMCDVVCEELVTVLREVEADPGSVARRWVVNLFLNRWLDYCLVQGHRFVSPVILDNPLDSRVEKPNPRRLAG